MAGKKEETFVIRIHDCQNSTWQGSILWAERQERKCFRSTLEMISLIEEAVQLDRENKALEGGYHEK
ncbi:MAG TPA: hypothetical protein H9935_03825 [Candidatus Blautia merdigallinarum]|uniref:Uncharacterized protein n=1 Tax=Candidatus Blautia merdigallinarum TaxID=2838495 RepID=A0A9D2SJW5_9FIRM|nr:hypothetical protein [Clostridiales bacterium]HJC09929.1 hypothetical protein [Candidatus Blautia merdigallinarum]